MSLLALERLVQYSVSNAVAILFVLVLLSLLLRRKRLAWFWVGVLFFLSMPISYKVPLHYLEGAYIGCHTKTKADAVVILGGGVTWRSNFDPKMTVSRRVLSRIRFGVYLSRLHHIPIILSSGKNEVRAMRRMIEDEYQWHVDWVDTQSLTTDENARFSEKIIRSHHLKSIYLVTNTWHLKRSAYLFRRHMPDIEIYPCGGYYDGEKVLSFSWRDLIPTMHAFGLWRIILSETSALWWYRFVNTDPSRALY